jgi:hypothetical protein
MPQKVKSWLASSVISRDLATLIEAALTNFLPRGRRSSRRGSKQVAFSPKIRFPLILLHLYYCRQKIISPSGPVQNNALKASAKDNYLILLLPLTVDDS